MANILQFIKDYGPLASVLFSLIALIAVFVINSKVANALKRIIKLKDDTRLEKSKVLVEAFRVINKLKANEMGAYKELADELDEVYSRMYSVVTDAKLIQAYHRVVTLFILGGKPSLVEFEGLARKELGLIPVIIKTKQPYILMINSEEEKIKAKQELEEQKRLEEEALLKQKEAIKQQKLALKQEKKKGKERFKEQSLNLKQQEVVNFQESELGLEETGEPFSEEKAQEVVEPLSEVKTEEVIEPKKIIKMQDIQKPLDEPEEKMEEVVTKKPTFKVIVNEPKVNATNEVISETVEEEKVETIKKPRKKTTKKEE